MNIDEAMLRAYVDSELPRDERSHVEAALTQSVDLRHQVEHLRASCLPYRAAFDGQVVPPIPETLRQQIETMLAVSKSGADVIALPRRAWLTMGAGLAAAFAVGAYVSPSLFRSNSAPAEELADWVKSVANYQAMYVRDTVDRIADNSQRASSVINDFQAETRAEFTVPDLSAAGFEFKRIQRLAVRVGNNEKPLIQMAYLPAKGKPAALCVLASEKQAQAAVSARHLENLSIVTWTHGQLSYVFAADLPLPEAVAIGEKLEADKFPVLYKV
jgi:anti-sigma factor RsiW